MSFIDQLFVRAPQALAVTARPLRDGTVSAQLSSNAMDDLVRMVGESRSNGHIHLFIGDDPALKAGIIDAVQSGRSMSVVGDRLLMSNGKLDVGVPVRPFGIEGEKLHVKAGSFDDGERAWWSTGAADVARRSRNEAEVSANLWGDSARALHRILTTPETDVAGMRAAAEDAARAGVLINDPPRGITTVTTTAQELARGERFLMVGKTIDVNPYTRQLAERRGGDTSVWVRKGYGKGDVNRLRDLGLEVRKLPKGIRQHANVLVAGAGDERRMIVTTAAPIQRGLGTNPSAQQSRELGLLVDDQPTIDSVLDTLGAWHGVRFSQ